MEEDATLKTPNRGGGERRVSSRLAPHPARKMLRTTIRVGDFMTIPFDRYFYGQEESSKNQLIAR